MFLQATLFDSPEPTVPDGFAAVRRTALDATSWVDHASGWLPGANALFEDLLQVVAFTQQHVVMWERLLTEPRLSAWWRHGDGPEPVPLLGELRRLLGARYDVDFDSIGFNLYRNGDDSVAWHADTKGPPVVDPTIAILSLGARRPLRLRPKGGGESLAWFLDSGDLLVMGGACQARWEHSVPKTRRAAGARMSLVFRHSGVF